MVADAVVVGAVLVVVLKDGAALGISVTITFIKLKISDWRIPLYQPINIQLIWEQII